MCAIKNRLQDFRVYEKEVPCIPRMVPVSKKKICFLSGRRSLHRAVKSLQFKWRKCHTKIKILVERTDTVI
jgi:hypothetical protein